MTFNKDLKIVFLNSSLKPMLLGYKIPKIIKNNQKLIKYT